MYVYIYIYICEDDWVERMEKVDEAVRLMVEEAEWEEA